LPGWIRQYRRSDLSRDLLAGLAVAVVLIPQGIAYALLAGLPAAYGLYASVVPAIVYALFGTSRHMPVGPPALMALLTFAGVSAVAEPGTEEYVSLALLLALMAGSLQLILGLLRAGFVANFVPPPVLSGFVFASAIIIIFSQTDDLLGVEVERGARSAVDAAALAGSVAETNPTVLTLSASCIGALVLLARLMPRIPGPLLVVAGATLASWALGPYAA
jgi:SulP family sulfate permease